VPSIDAQDLRKINATREGWAYNCHANEKVEDFYVPKLQEAGQARLKRLSVQEAKEEKIKEA